MKLNTLARTLLPFCIAASLFGCGSSNDFDEGTEYSVTVASQPVYFGIGLEFTPILDGLGETQGGLDIFAGSIVGFDYEFGTSYELRVIQHKVDTDGVADGGSTSTKLIEVISSEADSVGTKYIYDEVELRGSPFSDEGEGIYTFYQYEFLCSESVDCDSLVAIGDSGGIAQLEFEYTAGLVPITLIRWN